MATSQGMCKNCGSLIMFDDRDSKCECVFCHCVFPASEAVEILSNPEGRTFANEKFEASTDSHHYTTRVYSTESLEKQIKRDEITRAQNKDNNAKKSEFEIDAKDVKAPKKLVVGLAVGITVFVLAIAAISVPSYMSRTKITDSLEHNITSVYSGNIVGHSFFGQKCETLNLITNDEIDEAQANLVYDNFCEQRAAANQSNNDNVTVVIYCDGGIYTVNSQGATFQADEQPSNQAE